MRAVVAVCLVLALGTVACDRREDPGVDPESQGVSSPTGEIVDSQGEASADASRVPATPAPVESREDAARCAGEEGRGQDGKQDARCPEGGDADR